MSLPPIEPKGVQLMELQAIRRMENGSLTLAQEEMLGTTLMRAAPRALASIT